MVIASKRKPLAFPVVVTLALAACIDDPTFDENGKATNASTAAEVFTDAFGPNVDFAAFQYSKLDALYGIDTSTAHAGRASLRVDVPSTTDPAGGFAGGAFVTGAPRDLSGYNALTFWAKAERSATVAAVGIGNDNTGQSKYTCERSDLAVTTSWQRFVIPMPAPAKVTSERGMFYFSVAAEPSAAAFKLWFDDVIYEKLPTSALAALRGAFPVQSATLTVGQQATVKDATVTAEAYGATVTAKVSPGVFDYVSSAPAVATVSDAGQVTAVATGSANVTGTLGGQAVTGAIAVSVVNPSDSIVAFLSNVYPQRPVEKWLADWSMPQGQVAVSLAPDGAEPQRTYSKLQFAGIEFTSAANQIDASAMTRLHVDLKSADASEFHIKLVDFGANGTADPFYDGGAHGDDSAYELILTKTSSPALPAGSEWVSIDVPLASLRASRGPSVSGSGWAHLAQIAVAGPSSGRPLIESIALKNLYLQK